jgi:hypothetical protein
MIGSLLSRLPDAANPNGYTSDIVFPYLVYDSYVMPTPVSEIRFWGFNLWFNAGWYLCTEDPMPFNITFYQDNAGSPGAVVATFNPTLTRLETNIQLFGWPIYQYDFTLPTPVNLPSGWVSIQGAGDPLCNFLWAVSATGGSALQQYPDNSMVQLGYTMSLCMLGSCDPATQLTVLRGVGPGDHVNIRFHAPVDGNYDVYMSSVKNNDGDPNGGADPDWTLLTTVAATAGYNTTADAPLVPYANYVVVHDCTPMGRCCYGDPLNPLCASPVGEEFCLTLEGTWTFGLNCTDNPCPIAPPNDNCGDVTPVPCPLNETGDNTLATHDCFELTVGEGETWHAFTTDVVTNTHIIECGDNGLWGDFYIVMEPGCPCPGYYFATNWTFPNPGCIDILYAGLPAGTWYIPVLREAAYQCVGPYTIQVNCEIPPPPPPNDDCGNAIVIPSFPYTDSGNNTGATNDCGLTGWPELWYTFTTTEMCNLVVAECGSQMAPTPNSTIWILTGCPCSGNVVASNYENTSCGDGNWTIYYDFLPPGTYYYPIYSGLDSQGPYTVTFTCSAPPPGPCPAGAVTCDEYIDLVNVSTINNASGCGLVGGYSDYTGISTNMTAGTGYPIAVHNPTPYDGDAVNVWVDWNNNDSFLDAGEYFATTSGDNSNFSGTVTPPAGSSGTHRMRVRISYYPPDPPTPCGTDSYGEVEDYTVIVP